MLVGEHQKAGDHGETHGYRQKLAARQEGHGIADEADQGKGAHASERVVLAAGVVLLPLQARKKRQGQDQQDLGALRRQCPVEIQHAVDSNLYDIASPESLFGLAGPIHDTPGAHPSICASHFFSEPSS